MKNYSFAILKKLTFILFLVTIISCSEQVTISKNAFVIKNISIIDPIDGFQSVKHVVVEHDLIAMILDKNYKFLANEDKIIDGSGKFLIPGLWDAHVHFSYDKNLTSSMPRLFLAHGITSVRDTGGPIDYVLKAKEFSLNEPMKSPNIFIAGPLIDGSPNVYNDSSPSFPLLSIENQDIIDIESNTMGLIDKGIDFLKAYEMLNENQFLAITKIARKQNLKVTGHIPLSMNLFSAVNSGLNGMEHLRNLELSIASNAEELYEERIQMLKNPNGLLGSTLRSSIHSKQRMSAIDSVDNNKFEEAANLLASKNVWQTPTLILYRSYAQKSHLNPSFLLELNKLPQQVKQKWSNEIAASDTIIDKSSVRYSNWIVDAVSKLHKNNVPFMAGTDTPIGYLIPGRSLHRELEILVESGLSNLEAIKTATVNPATFFGIENKVGRIKNGFMADLLILNSNPLNNISNTQNIHAVIKNGHFLSRKSLDSLLYNNHD
jgi:imidazolonepropionase-like amidohydrolase